MSYTDELKTSPEQTPKRVRSGLVRCMDCHDRMSAAGKRRCDQCLKINNTVGAKKRWSALIAMPCIVDECSNLRYVYAGKVDSKCVGHRNAYMQKRQEASRRAAGKREKKIRLDPVPDGMGWCTKCDEARDLDRLYVSRTKLTVDGVRWGYRCRVCNPQINRRINHKLTEERFQELYAAQGGLCGMCSEPMAIADAKVDHDHDIQRATGEIHVRGLLHNNCNSGLGMFADSAETAIKAALYLTRGANAANDSGAVMLLMNQLLSWQKA